MAEDILWSCSHAAVKGEEGNRIEDISLVLRKKQITALISEDESAGEVLKLIAGLYVPDRGNVDYPCMPEQKGTFVHKRFQYVPDDIVCYDGLNVKEFLHGMANGNEELEEAAKRLVDIFGIDEKEPLLEMTFEQNRLVSMIQAMMAKPLLLLLNRPYDMLRENTYRLLIRELIGQFFDGTALVMAAQSYDNLIMPCHKYLFLESGKIKACYNRDQLPRPSKVVTMWGGDISSLLPEKMEVLVKRRNYFRFLYREQSMRELAIRLSKTGCDNFNIEELTMEEEIFHNYERWLP